MDVHIPYEQVKNRECDFIVTYRFFTPDEGGRKTGNPMQGYRSDFMYSGDEKARQQWMIWPEFLDDKDNVILDKSFQVPTSGKANMWILNDTLTELHKRRIKIGLKAFFMEGQYIVAECEVIQIVNPNLK
ncbi:hypothetical protein L1276_001555 [Flavobacterium sp. HSC-32F16]|uniref:hypothetical protein n=1 Tax=Flavobacterium sp. HSC-32F16 TaxID=2910964 RepID=UPI0020A4801E|nr:hypothetical protein [Flavobacterium sp. HSC-32F16]MCP2026411.1 hypothetical protein [Flavobacterium sp. HSC-32F16]